jgi:DNA invertase Pin-like site-specific DNA recombinase
LSALPKRAALYARVSTDDQSVDLQLNELRAVATSRGWSVVEYVDRGVSGAVLSREELDRLMTDARNGKLDVVAVWKFDRFARSTEHLLASLREFRSVGVDFLSIREAIDTSTAMGRMVFAFLGAVAEFEREIIVERVKAGVAHAQAKGIHCGRPVIEIPSLAAAETLIRQGVPLRDVARQVGVSRSTLRRRLVEAGLWAQVMGG